MKTSVETINGKLCTVIRRPFDAEWVREQLAMGIPVIVEEGEFNIRRIILEHEHKPDLDDMPFLRGRDYSERYFGFSRQPLGAWTPHRDDKNLKYTVAILPALPRHPKPEDAPLLYRYASEWVEIHGKADIPSYNGNFPEWKLSDYGVKPFIERDLYHVSITNATDMETGERVEVAIEGRMKAMNLDRTFCASPTHNPDCDRQITPEINAALDKAGKGSRISVSYFCGGEPKDAE